MYYLFPAIFTSNAEGGYIVKVPDIPDCVSRGRTLEQATKMIKDALCKSLCKLEDKLEPPKKATPPEELRLADGEFIALIDADTTKYRIANDSRSVRRNVSLPAWLNAMADQANINCSQLLQKALREELGA